MKTNIPKILSVLLLIAIGYLILYIFVFLDKPEIFEKASEVGILFYRLCIGYIAATMFYFIVNYFPQKSKRAKMLTNLQTQVDGIEVNINSILNEFNYPDGIETLTLENYTTDGINSILENTAFDFRTNVNYVGQERVNIIEHIKVKTGDVNKELQDIEKHIDLISPELFKAIKDVERMPVAMAFVGAVDMIRRQRLPNENFVFLTDIFVEYLNKVRIFKSEWKQNKN